MGLKKSFFVLLTILLVATACEKSIHQAASSNDLQRIRILLENNSTQVNERDSFKRTPLHWAVDKGNRKIAELLIESGADVNVKDKFNKSPLDYAVENEYNRLATLLIVKGADISPTPDAVKENIITTIKPIHVVARNGKLSSLKMLLDKYPRQVNVKDEYGRIPLYWAARAGHMDIVKLLIEKGSNVNAKADEGWTPLHTTAYNGKDEAAEYLIQKGAVIDIRNEDGETPLYWAAKRGHFHLVKLFVDNGADVEARAKNGKTPISVASNTRISDLLKKKKGIKQ